VRRRVRKLVTGGSSEEDHPVINVVRGIYEGHHYSTWPCRNCIAVGEGMGLLCNVESWAFGNRRIKMTLGPARGLSVFLLPSH
jgi:hypothetical protein